MSGERRRGRSGPRRRDAEATPEPAPTVRRAWSQAAAPAAIVSASAALGLLAVWQYTSSPFFHLPILDEESYWQWARRIVSGEAAREPYFQDPLYPYVLSLVIRVFGESLAAVRLLQVAMGAASVAVVGVAARRLLGRGPGLAAMVVMALNPGLHFFELQIEKSVLAILISSGAILLGILVAERPGGRGAAVLLGLSLGLLTLLRGNVRLLLPFVLAWALLLRPRGAPAARRALLVAAGIAAAILPFTIRNYLVSGTWVLTTSHGGINFYMGNNALATGRYVTLPFMRANPVGEAEDSRKEAERRTRRTLSPAEVSAFWLAEGLRWIRENPAAAAALWLHKARLVVHEHEIPDNHSLYVTRDLFVPALHVPRLGFGLLWGPALIGALVLPWRDPRAGLPALFLVLYGASLVPFFVLDRYRLPMVPALSILAVAGALQVRRFLARGDVRRVAAVVAAAAAALFVGLGPTPESGAPVAVELYLVGNAYLKTGSPEKALPHLRQALRVYPDREDFRLSHMEALRQTNSLTVEQVREEVRREGATAARLLDLGKTLEGLGDVAGAVEAYGRAVRQDRDHAPAHARLGYLFATAPEVRDPARAAAHLEETLRLRPDDPDTLNALGNVEFLRGDREAAGTYWRRVLAVSPGHPGATQNLAALGDGKGTP